MQHPTRVAVILASVLGLCGAAAVPAYGQTRRVSVTTGGAETGGGGDARISPDGRFVAFDSVSALIVAGDTNSAQDVFVHDRVTAQTTRVSVATGGGEANGASDEASISRGGRYVAFESLASNLVASDTNGVSDVFVHDRLTATTIRVSVGSGGEGFGPSLDGRISADGRFVAFRSGADNLIAGDTNNVDDIFVHDRDLDADGAFDEPGQTVTIRVSVTTDGTEANSSSRDVRISANGRFLAFEATARNLASPAPDLNAARNIYLRDRDADNDGVFDESGPGEVSTIQVNITSGGVPADGDANSPAISADGRYISFESQATNLFPGDTAGPDIVVHDRATGGNVKVNKATDGTPGAGGSLAESWLSGDGRFVVFASSETNLVASDLNGAFDIFLHDRDVDGDGLFDEPGQVSTSRVSVSTGGAEGDADSEEPTIAEDGSVVAFESSAGNLVPGDTNALGDVFTTAASVNVVQNADFTSGTTGWLQFATPDMSYIVSQVTDGVFEFYRIAPAPGETNQAVIFQRTGATFEAGMPVDAEFDLGNSSSVRKRIGVLVHDSDFGDLFVCTFWLQPNAPLRTYAIRTHTTRAWADATIAFYAAAAGSDGGFYQLDNVFVRTAPGSPADRTTCADPMSPAPVSAAPGPDFLTNGDFGTGSLAPWALFGQITSQIVSGVFEFYRPAGTPAGVILQPTGQPVAAGRIFTATFQLGNSSAVRKRVTAILHDNDFTDLSACTFWLAPGQALADYSYRSFTTKAWTNATLSVYPATVGADEWIRLDNVTFRETPAAAILGTECVEPVQPPPPPAPPAPAVGRAAGLAAPRLPTAPAARLDLREATGAYLRFHSWSAAWVSEAEVQVSTNGIDWITVAIVPRAGAWQVLDVDLSEFDGAVILVRLVARLGS